MSHDAISVRTLVIGAGIAGLLAAVIYHQRTSQHASHHVASRTPGLKIIVVGAGISGLCAAVALRQAGHQVEVRRRSS
jgi:protoporphyrinogen oxidase